MICSEQRPKDYSTVKRGTDRLLHVQVDLIFRYPSVYKVPLFSILRVVKGRPQLPRSSLLSCCLITLFIGPSTPRSLITSSCQCLFSLSLLSSHPLVLILQCLSSRPCSCPCPRLLTFFVFLSPHLLSFLPTHLLWLFVSSSSLSPRLFCFLVSSFSSSSSLFLFVLLSFEYSHSCLLVLVHLSLSLLFFPYFL